MKYFWLRLYPEQPLHLDDPLLINGRTIRGMIAAAALRSCLPNAKHEDGACGPSCLYWPLFGTRSGLRIGPAYAASLDDVYPFAPTAYTCRQNPGFRGSGQHGVTDTLIRNWVFEDAITRNTTLYVPPELRCPACGGELVPCEGLWGRIGERQYQTIEASTQAVETRHRSINRARGRHLQPFQQTGYELGTGLFYSVRLNISDTLEPPLRTVLYRDLFLGGRRTRGMGRVRAELIPRPDPANTLHLRIAAINKAIRTERRFYAAMDENAALEDDGAWYFTIDFPEGAVLDAVHLNQPLAGIRALQGVKILRQWLRAGQSGGWSISAGLPARTQPVCYGALICSVPPEEDRAQLEGALSYLEANGIGLERDRGYGQVIVCDPFHLEQDPV